MPAMNSTMFNETINEVLRSLGNLIHTDVVTSSGATSSNADSSSYTSEGFVSTLNAIHCLNNMSLFLNVVETNVLYTYLCGLSAETLAHDDLL